MSTIAHSPCSHSHPPSSCRSPGRPSSASAPPTRGDAFNVLELTHFFSNFKLPDEQLSSEGDSETEEEDEEEPEVESDEADEADDGTRDEVEQDCCICFETYSAGDMARLPDCNHTFCRECLAGHVRAKISEQTFPIYCPLCVCNLHQEVKTEIDQRTLDKLADVFDSEEYEKFEVLQLSLFAMSLQCPDCKHEMMIAREDLHLILVSCPVTACGAQWCRACHAKISVCEPTWHRCKRDSKFRRLMRRKGWRFCPGCRTPFLRDQGCAHMTCTAPGCHTHFCYRCGGTIWKLGDRGTAYRAARNHARWCRLVFPLGTKCRIM